MALLTGSTVGANASVVDFQVESSMVLAVEGFDGTRGAKVSYINSQTSKVDAVYITDNHETFLGSAIGDFQEYVDPSNETIHIQKEKLLAEVDTQFVDVDWAGLKKRFNNLTKES
jgi:hypothetical protein